MQFMGRFGKVKFQTFVLYSMVSYMFQEVKLKILSFDNFMVILRISGRGCGAILWLYGGLKALTVSH